MHIDDFKSIATFALNNVASYFKPKELLIICDFIATVTQKDLDNPLQKSDSYENTKEDKKMTELELYKFINNNDIEYHYVDNDGYQDIIIFVNISEIEEFNKLMKPSTDEYGTDCKMMDGYFAFWMKDFCEYYGIDISQYIRTQRLERLKMTQKQFNSLKIGDVIIPISGFTVGIPLEDFPFKIMSIDKDKKLYSHGYVIPRVYARYFKKKRKYNNA